MGNLQTKQWRKRLLAGVATAVMALTITPSAFAQAGADAGEVQSINISAGPLGDVLLEISTLFDVNIIASELVVAGKSAPSITGSLTPEAALALALQGSGLVARPESTGGYVIVLEEASTSASTERVTEVIIVTGTKQNRSVQETTSSVEIFDFERLEDEAIFTLNEALSRSANTSVIGNNINNINIRGINRNGTGGAGQGQAINVFVDGAPISTPGLDGINTLWDTQQVEVLRGSQSTVQGRNAIAGAVIVQSKTPSYEWEGAARARIAEFGTRQYAGVISGPIIEDQLAFRLSADHQKSDGSITDGFSGEDDNFQDSLTIRARALIEPDAIEKLRALLTLEYSDRENGRITPTVFSPDLAPDAELGIDDVVVNPDFFENFDPDNRVTFPLIPRFTDNETFKVIGDITYDFSDAISLKLLGTYEDTRSITRELRTVVSDFGDVGRVSDGDNTTYTAEARLEFDFEKLSGLVGGYYFNFESERDIVATFLITDLISIFPINPSDSLVIGDQLSQDEVENYAFFTSWRFEPNEKWDFDFGLRYDREEFSVNNQPGDTTIAPDECETTIPGIIIGSSAPLVTVPCSFASQFFLPDLEPLQSDSFDVFLPNGAVTYSFNSDFSVFASVRRGYRAGGTFLAGSQAMPGLFEVVTFGPEFLLSYEAGWRSQWLDKKLTVNGTAFFSDYQDQQVRFLDEEQLNRTVNAGDTSIYGLELSADYQATADWNIYGSIGLLESDINEFEFQADDPSTKTIDESIDLSGNDLSRSPNVSFTLGASYDHESGLFG
ncbi:MAG: TonB-dependent receptor, partial [Pseudomonadota bacterium]